MHRLLTGLALLALAAIAAITAPYAQEIRVGPIVLSDPWTRATAPSAPTGAGFVTVENGGTVDDRLVAAASPAAETVELHTMAMQDGVMTMRRLDDGIPVPAGEVVALAPGGLHIMFIGLESRFEEGGTVPVTLTFETAGEVTIDLPVGPIGAASAAEATAD